MLLLEPFQEKDFNRLISWIATEEMMYQFAGAVFHFPVTKEQLYDYITTVNRKPFRVREISTGEIIGHCEIGNIDFRNNSARFCRILIADPKNRNRGYGKLIITELLKIAFNDMLLHRVDLGVFDFNHSAIACYKKCGLKIEGLLRENFLIRDAYYSVFNMSILREEWCSKRF